MGGVVWHGATVRPAKQGGDRQSQRFSKDPEAQYRSTMDGHSNSLELSYARVRSRAGIKWNKFEPDVLPAWVADMDFDPPAPVLDAIRKLVDDGDLGYARAAEHLAPTYAEWQHARSGWEPDVERIRTFTSALHALETAICCCTEPGDGIVVFTPIYYPFLDAIESSGRRRVDVPLTEPGWRLDAERLAATIDDTTRMVLFCNPHNPTGRLFDDDEIGAVAEVAERHDLLVVTDEIWGELTHGRAHRPLAIVDERFAGRLVTLGSASKTFNLAGLRCAVAHIDHAPLIAAIEAMPGHLLGAPSTLGVAGTLAAWSAGGPWLDEARAALTARRDQLVTRLERDAPAIRVSPPEATYLAWLDFRDTELGDDPSEPLLEHARVALSSGPKFGPNGVGFARVNFATSPEILDDIIDRITAAVH